MADSMREIAKSINNSLDNVEKTMSRIADAMSEVVQSNINATEKSQNKINEANKKIAKDINEANEKSAENQNRAKKETAEKINTDTKSTVKTIGDYLLQSTFQAINNFSNGISNEYKRMLTEYTEAQQMISYNMLGAGMTWDTVKSALGTLSTSAFVKQTEVFKNLTTLVQSGISYNAAQRAFLVTTANNVGLEIDTQSEKFNNLIQLYHEDMTSARLAQMHGLKTFLDQNYENSQYIKQGFSQVSDALYEMQSVMRSAADAMATEKTIQAYLGSFSSAGGNTGTATNIAQALGAIGSGDFSGLSDGMQNLMVMAASRAGLSYADLLTGGLNEADSQKLMTSLFTYIASMQDTSGGSNVAMSAIAKIFGVNISDIKAAQNMNINSLRVSSISDNISNFLYDYTRTATTASKGATLWENLISNQAIDGSLLNYKLSESITGAIGNALSFGGSAFGGVAGAAAAIAGELVKNIPAFGVMGGMLGDIGGIKNLFSWSQLKSLVTGGAEGYVEETINRIMRDQFSGLEGADNINPQFLGLVGNYNDLGNNWVGSNNWFSSGSFRADVTGVSKSGKTTNTGESYSQDKTALEIAQSLDDIEENNNANLTDLYNLLHDDFPTMTWATGARIVDGYNSVLIQSAEYTHYIGDMITLTAVSAEGILNLLESRFNLSGESIGVSLTPTWSNSWSGTANPSWLGGV